ncbi:MAG: hypothetical protein P4L73_17700 [Caulobacteraceae bacterium]|nr:hypothetical protein [Caulobacteraceae bacterium]
MGVAISVLVIVALVVLIIRALVGHKSEVKITYGGPVQPSALPPLPKLTPAEIEARSSAMVSEWVEYAGATPPLRLHVRGQSHETYRLFSRKHIDLIGEDAVQAMPETMLANLNHIVMADAYVTGWEGAVYPNGAPMPYSPRNLAIMMGADPYLVTFISQTAERLSPPWP